MPAPAVTERKPFVKLADQSGPLTDFDELRIKELDRKIERLVQKLQKVWNGWGEQGAETLEEIRTELNRTIRERDELRDRVDKLEYERDFGLMLVQTADTSLNESATKHDEQKKALEDELNRVKLGGLGYGIAAFAGCYFGLSPEMMAVALAAGAIGATVLGDTIKKCREPKNNEIKA